MTPKPGLLTTLLEIALSFGLHYLLRAFGLDVFRSLVIPAIAVGVIAVAVTVRRRRIDLMGLLATQSPRVAALREVAYILVGGVFCLVTLVRRRPLAHTTAASMASFGDPTREKAFELAWAEEPRYRRWQRLLTATLGALMVGAGVIRAYILYAAPDSGIAHAVDVSNVVGHGDVGGGVRRPRRPHPARAPDRAGRARTAAGHALAPGGHWNRPISPRLNRTRSPGATGGC
ncbi:VC0807 family protein [Amycolatopsis sp. cmx-8-4]|uniref:VC0807 family protein n=1 Tax=Amycolatopsis sp. cmx-8-4 TaxID=2790947 RepID=UPI00397E5C4A